MIIRKLFIIIMGIFLVICAGSCNIYPLYLKIMMDKFHLSLKEVNLYGSSINLGLWVAFPMGWLYDSYGPKISCIIGAIALSGTNMVLYVIMKSSLTSFSLLPLLLIGIIMGQGSALCYTCSVTTNLKNFRFKESSCIVGLLVANLAISPSIFTTYKEYLTDVQISSYFLVISIFLAIVITLCGFVFTNIKNVYSAKEDIKSYEKYKEKKYIKVFILINIVTLIIYTFGVIFNNIVSETRFPNVVVYPCLQLLNFTVIILEYFGIFDKFFFKEFIDKEIRKELKINDLQPASINQSNTKKSAKSNRDILKEENTNPEKEKNSISVNSVSKEGNNSLNMVQIESKDIKNDAKTDLSPYKSKDSQQFEEINIDKDVSDSIDKPKEDKKEKELKEIELKIVSINAVQNNIINQPLHNEASTLNPINTDCDIKVDFYESIKNRKILVLFIMLIFGTGSMIANLNNIEFIVKSIAYNQSPTEIFEFVILYFAFNSFFRIISGIILDKLIRARRFYHFFILVSFIGLTSQILGIFMEKNILFLSISLAGATHGGYMTFVPIYVRIEYGTEHMGKVLGILTTGAAVGSLLMADLVFTIFYDAFETDGKCFGKRCYYPAYIISSFLLMVNCGLSFYFKKLHDKNKTDEIKKIEKTMM